MEQLPLARELCQVSVVSPAPDLANPRLINTYKYLFYRVLPSGRGGWEPRPRSQIVCFRIEWQMSFRNQSIRLLALQGQVVVVR